MKIELASMAVYVVLARVGVFDVSIQLRHSTVSVKAGVTSVIFVDAMFGHVSIKLGFGGQNFVTIGTRENRQLPFLNFLGMVHHPVIFQAVVTSEGLIAILAHMTTVHVVPLCVHPKTRFTFKCAPTDITHKIFSSSVCLKVGLKSRADMEFLVTFGTREQLGIRMPSSVCIE